MLFEFVRRMIPDRSSLSPDRNSAVEIKPPDKDIEINKSSCENEKTSGLSVFDYFSGCFGIGKETSIFDSLFKCFGLNLDISEVNDNDSIDTHPIRKLSDSSINYEVKVTEEKIDIRSKINFWESNKIIIANNPWYMTTSKIEGQSSPVWFDMRTLSYLDHKVEESHNDAREDIGKKSDTPIELNVPSILSEKMSSSNFSSIQTLSTGSNEYIFPLPSFKLMDHGFLDFLLLHMFPMNSKMKTSVSFPISKAKKVKNKSLRRSRLNEYDILLRYMIPLERSLRKTNMPTSISESSYLWKKLISLKEPKKTERFSLCDLDLIENNLWNECFSLVFPTLPSINRRISLPCV